VLEGLLQPTPLPPPQTRAELAREERSTIVEAAKDRWNAEVENAIRWVQRTDWDEVRGGMESAVSRLLSGGLQKSREGIEEAEKQAGPKVQEALDRSKATAQQAASQIGAQAKEQANQLGTKAAEVRDSVRADARKTAADLKSGAQESVKHSGGTVNATRGALRDAVGKGIEMGKEAVGKAQAAVGLAEEKLESRGQSLALSHSAAVEKALHERYEQPKALPSLEEALEERYKAIDQRDNTVLRGV
jgi:altered-inheritance-of-mitochondria protein 5